MSIAEQLSAELKRQAENSRKVIERIPESKLTWKPHEKSMPIGRLGMHIAELPSSAIRALQTAGFDFATAAYKPVFPNTVAEILETFDKSLAAAVEALGKTTDKDMGVVWKARRGDQLVYEMPRADVVRRTLDHIIHHRGQLTVYLRLLDVPVPPTFGPTADER